MSIQVTCDCGKGYRVSADKAGKRFKCRECGTLLQVPDANAADDTNDDDDVEMEQEAEYVPAHHRAAAKARSAKKNARDQKRAAALKRWLLIGGIVAVVFGGLTCANVFFSRVMLKVWPGVSFYFQFLLIPTFLLLVSDWSCRRRIRAEIRSHDGTVTTISWRPFQDFPSRRRGDWEFIPSPAGSTKSPTSTVTARRSTAWSASRLAECDGTAISES